MPEFHNPYHFVPLAGEGSVSDISVNDFAKNDTPNTKHLTHDKYVKETHSGRIICKLTAKTPFFVGSESKQGSKGANGQPDQPGTAKPFKLDSKPAIPASSLRGVISSLAEAASNSALRVLEDKYYSRRANIRRGESLSAIGMIKEVNGIKKLLPLALPTLTWEKERNGAHWKRKAYPTIEKKWKTVFAKAPRFKVYLDREFLENKRPSSFHAGNPKDFWYLDTSSCSINITSGAITEVVGNVEKKVKVNDNNGNPDYLIGVKATLPGIFPTRTIVQANRGILRVLGVGVRNATIPQNKIHEFFIPYPDPSGAPPIPSQNDLLEISPNAWERFRRLASARRVEGDDPNRDKRLPYRLKDAGDVTTLTSKKDEYELNLREGDLVFFDADDSGKSVTELSVSSLWRKEIPETGYRFFADGNFNAVPFNNDRSKITLAERVFGFVSEVIKNDDTRKILEGKKQAFPEAEAEKARETAQANLQLQKEGRCTLANGMVVKMVMPKKAIALIPTPLKREVKDVATYDKPKEPPTAFASRVRFSNAIFHPNDKIKSDKECFIMNGGHGITLKILASPKPPSPAMYFKKKNLQPGQNGYISKAELKAETCAPQGRKMYLHHTLTNANPTPWKTNYTNGADAHLNQKMKITPVKQGAEFWFHVDFDNLDETELGLLCYALEPDKEFHHKIGMGKPIGLGSVKIEPVCVLTVGRKDRYTADGFFKPRYNTPRFRDGFNKKSAPDSYKQMWAIPNVASGAATFNCASDIQSFPLNKTIANAIKLLGDLKPNNPNNETIPVHTPTTTQQNQNDEKDTFKWFGNNDGSQQPRHLKPIIATDTHLPTLNKN